MRSLALHPPRAQSFELTATRTAWLCVALAGLINIPYLGAVGLWDPWETHYSEVGREMISRGDLIHPYWQDAWFFSKPALAPWLSALGLWLSGATSGSGELPLHTEWFVRAPFCALSLLAVGLLSYTVARFATPRAGLWTGLALSTMPLWALVSRQAMTDMAYVGPATAAVVCLAVACLNQENRNPRWALAGWALCGLAMLGKGLLGVCFPLAVIGLTLAVERRWKDFLRLELVKGPLVFLAVSGPWYGAMLAFSGRDNEGKTFFERFFLHDHFARFASGVHTTTPGGSFTYYLEQGGYGVFLWALLIPAAVVHALALTKTDGPRARLARLGLLWSLLGFAVFSASATRFHHYCLPMLPGLALLLGLLLEDWKETDVPSLLFGLALVALIGKDLSAEPRRFTELFTYNHERPFPGFLLDRPFLSGAPAWLDVHTFLKGVTGAAVLLGAVALLRRRFTLRAFAGLAVAFSLWLSWSHWVALSHHWTQKDLFHSYFSQRGEGEPIAAFFMDWKGETFYSRNQVLQLGPANSQRATPEYLARAGRKWLLVEHSRLQWLTQVIGPAHQVQVLHPDLNNKFVLLRVD